MSDYLSLVTTLLLAFGLCFQLPVILALLGLAGIVSSKMLAGARRYAIVGVFAVAAVLTPPDPISMMTPGPAGRAALRNLDPVRLADRASAQARRRRGGAA